LGVVIERADIVFQAFFGEGGTATVLFLSHTGRFKQDAGEVFDVSGAATEGVGTAGLLQTAVITNDAGNPRSTGFEGGEAEIFVGVRGCDHPLGFAGEAVSLLVGDEAGNTDARKRLIAEEFFYLWAQWAVAYNYKRPFCRVEVQRGISLQQDTNSFVGNPASEKEETFTLIRRMLSLRHPGDHGKT